jgi:hypothetical protein
LASLFSTADTKFDQANIGRTDFNDGTAIGWIREGAVREDGEAACDTRVANHFYNPLNNSGLVYRTTGYPSPDWALEDRADFSLQKSSYHDARDFFWIGLTADNDVNRQTFIAATFRSIGQIIHLIQDAAQPQHTRNDPHAGVACMASLGLFGPASVYEKYVDNMARAEVLKFSGYPVVQAAQPRHYWDTEFGEGIAEFTNRNFISTGTNFSGSGETLYPPTDFPKPNGLSAVTSRWDIQGLLPGSGLHGVLTFIGTPYDDRYLGSVEHNDRTSTFSLFTADLKGHGLWQRFSLNRFNYDAAAAILIPRAVGYSAGMINYFFRGKLDLKSPDRLAYSLAHFNTAQPTSGGFDYLDVNVRNATPNETMGLGKLVAIVRYRNSWPNPLIDMAWNQLEPTWSYAISAEQNVQPTDDFRTISFDFTNSPIPVNAGDVTLLVAFRGPLTKNDAGYTEQDAIAIGGKDLYEPDLVDFGNITDYDCSGGQLYYTQNLATDHQSRDINHDGLPDVFGPWQLDQNQVRFYRTDDPAAPVSASGSNYTVPIFQGGGYSRLVVLQDQDQYVMTHTAETAEEPVTGYSASGFTAATFCGNINRLVEENGQSVHEVRYYGPTSFRGSTGARRVFYANQHVLDDATCFNAMPGQSVAITVVPDGTFHKGALE